MKKKMQAPLRRFNDLLYEIILRPLRVSMIIRWTKENIQ